MDVRVISILLLLAINQLVWGQSNYNTRVNLDINNQTIDLLFATIEQSANVKFSFNTSLINKDSIVTYHCANKSTRKVIKDLFDNKVLAKNVGRHIVLIENPKKTVVKQPINKAVILYGTIIDARTNKGIKDVNIYDIYSRETVLSDQDGKFQIKTELNQAIKTYNIAKNGYNNTVTTIDWSSQRELNIELLSIQEKIDQLEAKKIDNISAREKSKFLLGLVPMKSLISSENLSDISEKKITQVSFLPYIGTNWMSKGVIANNFSFNILAGYNGGVDGLEIGGLLNIVDKNVNGVQIAGLSNFVAGNVSGFQLAGLINRTKGKVHGVQVAGIRNEAFDTINGFQIAGITNYSKKPIIGAQISGILNTAIDSFSGIQLAGIHNRTTKKFNGAQVAGIDNILSDSLHGVQVAGIYNRVHKITKGAQISGILNSAKGDNNGLQLSLINKSGKNNGLQLGLINYSEQGKGIAIGLLNFVKNGYKSLEISANEFTHANLKYKVGSKYFYTILSFGIRPYNPDFRSVGLGFGTLFGLTKRSSLGIDITSSMVKIEENPLKYLNQNNRVDLNLDLRLTKRFGLFIGPSYNVFISNIKNKDLTKLKDIVIQHDPIFSSHRNNVLIHQWIGGNVGIRYWL